MMTWALLLLLPAASAEPDPERMLQDERVVSHGPLDATVHLAIGAWKGFFTLGDGARCPMRPTCSTYAQRAMTRDGAAGALLAFDRLMRDSNAAAYAPSPDGFHALDPLDDHAPALELLSGAYCRRQRADGSAACF